MRLSIWGFLKFIKCILICNWSILKTTENLTDAYIAEFDGDTEKYPNAKVGWYLRILLSIGNYYETVRDYEQIFGNYSVHLVDGAREVSDPNDEFGLLLKHFGLDPSLIEFEYNEEKGFYCLEKPVRFCLSDEKGHHSSFDLYEAYPDMAILREAYRPQMVKLFMHIFKCNRKVECCQLDIGDRFTWLRPYICEN